MTSRDRAGTTTTISAPRAVVGDAAGDALRGAVAAVTVEIRDGVITAVRDGVDPGATVVLDEDTVLLPGAVDTHVHLNEPGRTHWEGFATGTRAAAAGGVTTVVDMPLNSVPPTTSPAALAAKRAAADGKLSVQVGYWGGAVPDNLGRLEELWAAGVFGFKCFLSPSGVDEFPPLDPARFRAAMAEVAGFGGRMIVHAEDPAALDAAPARPSRAYADFLASRPDEAEVAAVRLVVDTVRETGARTHLLHLSSARALDLIADARAEGLPLTVETCPHYLCLDAGTIPDAAPEYKCCPPIRDRGNQEALWQALAEGLIDTVVTDHSPAGPEDKFAGDGDLQQAWGGIAGLQAGYSVMLDAAARRGLGPATVVGWMATGTADLVGLTDRGRIAPGARADLVTYAPARSARITAAALAHRHPISAWDGHRLAGSLTGVYLAGVPYDPAAAPRGRDILRPDPEGLR